VKASNFWLIFGFLTWFVLWCPQPSLLFVKELGKPVINGEAEPAPTLIHSRSWMSPCPGNNPKTHQRNVKIELRDPHLVEGPLYTGLKKLGAKFEHFWLFVWPQLTYKCYNIGHKGCKLASRFWWYPFLQPWGQYHKVQPLLLTWGRLIFEIFFSISAVAPSVISPCGWFQLLHNRNAWFELNIRLDSYCKAGVRAAVQVLGI